jgi:general secretion pathway protein A
MYAQYFGLNQDPFSIAPDPRYLFMSERHREALAHLLYGVSGHGTTPAHGAGGGFVLLTGDIGAGKTTICRCFLEQVPALCHVAYIFNPKLTVIELLQTVCEEFHVRVIATPGLAPTLKNHIDALNAFLLQSHAEGRNCVLIIDEAQNLQADVLEQLRLLTNLETSARKLLQIVLIGQPELRTMLDRPELEQLAQRVIARFHLDALSEGETAQYIAHRMAVGGLAGPLPFDRRALRRIHQLTQGVPRRINLLCGRALLGAWANGLRQVDSTVVSQAATEVFGKGATSAAHLPPQLRNALLGGICLLAGAALAWWAAMSWQPGSTVSAQPTLPGATSLRTPETTALTGASVSAAIDNLDTVLVQMPADINRAWNTLAPHWQLPADTTSPCEVAAKRQLQCFRTSQLTLPQLRQLGRPGMLGLRTEAGPPVYAVLAALDDHSATLSTGTRQFRVRLTALGQWWNGDYATYWRAPPGYSAPGSPGNGPALFEHLAQQLSRLDGAPVLSGATATLDAVLKERVRSFQRAHGLQADGLPGPLTFMQIESALGESTPGLPTASP